MQLTDTMSSGDEAILARFTAGEWVAMEDIERLFGQAAGNRQALWLVNALSRLVAAGVLEAARQGKISTSLSSGVLAVAGPLSYRRRTPLEILARQAP